MKVNYGHDRVDKSGMREVDTVGHSNLALLNILHRLLHNRGIFQMGEMPRFYTVFIIYVISLNCMHFFPFYR